MKYLKLVNEVIVFNVLNINIVVYFGVLWFIIIFNFRLY